MGLHRSTSAARRPCRPIVLALALTFQLPSAFAQTGVNSEASAVLRVRSTPHFTAIQVWPDGGGHRIEGFLHDEQNAPVTDAKVHVGASRWYRACPNNAPVTDEQGHFCVWIGEGPTSVTLSFAGNLHFDPTTLAVSVERTVPPPSLAVEVEREWFVGRADNTVRVLVDHAPANESPKVRLRVLDASGREWSLFTVEPEARQDARGAAAVFDLTPSRLPPAGPLTLEASLIAGDSEFAKTTNTIDLIAIVDVSVDSMPSEVRSGQPFTLHVSATGDSSVVNGGWVELREENVTLAMAPLTSASAQLDVELAGSREHTAVLELQYVSDKPWYRAGQPLRREVVVLAPLPWLHLPWAMLALGAGLWVVRTWRRPARAMLQSLLSPASDNLPRLKTTGEPSRSWRGTVKDAHSKTPLPGVHVALLAPQLKTTSALREAVTDVTGSFDLAELVGVPEGARLVFTSSHHSTLDQLAPGPCVMEVELSDRRRTLLAAFHDWVRGRSLTRVVDPTPREVAATARRMADAPAESWSLHIDEAVYGPQPPDGAQEAHLLEARPGPAVSAARAR